MEVISLSDKVYDITVIGRSEEHTSELQSRFELVCRLLLEKKKILHLSRNRHMSKPAPTSEDFSGEPYASRNTISCASEVERKARSTGGSSPWCLICFESAQ